MRVLVRRVTLQTTSYGDHRDLDLQHRYDAIEVKRWAWRVAQNVKRRTVARESTNVDPTVPQFLRRQAL